MISKLPLLQKELIEYASTKRLFILRVLFGLCLYTIFLFNWSHYTSYDNLYRVLGSGRSLLEYIYIINVIAIFVILPMTSACVITNEKEKRTLSLLLTTQLGPTAILFEKFLSLVVSIFSFLLISFPAMYMAYLLGGLTNKKIFVSLYAQFLTVMQVTAIGLFFSCYCKTSIKAIMATYIWGFVLYIFFPFFEVFENISYYMEIVLFPPGFYFYLDRYASDTWQMFVYTIPIWISVVVFLLGARHFLIVYPQRMNKKPIAQKVRDDFHIAKREVPHIRLPILWREGSHSTWPFAAKIFFIIGVVMGIGFVASLPGSRSNRHEFAMIIYFFALAVCALFLTMRCVTLFQREMKQETWDVLLTTTMTTRSIFWQKAMAVTRFTLYICILLLCIYTFNLAAFPRSYYSSSRLPSGARWVYSVALTLLIFISIQWFMIWLGLTFKKNRKIALVAVGLVAAWCLMPIVVSEFSREIFGGSRSDYRALALFSPFAMFVGVTEGRIPGYSNNMHVAMNVGFMIFSIKAVFFYILASASAQKHIRVCD